jgi:phosphomethylpyrimidine synthase
MCGPKFCSMRISQDIRRTHGGESAEPSAGASEGADPELDAEIAAGMAAKSAEFAAAGNRVYLPLAE